MNKSEKMCSFTVVVFCEAVPISDEEVGDGTDSMGFNDNIDSGGFVYETSRVSEDC